MTLQSQLNNNFCMKYFYCFLFTILLEGCTSTALLSQRGSYLRAYHAGELEKTEQNLNQLAAQEVPQKDCNSKNDSWILLDRATTRFALGKIEEAVKDYAAALETMDYFNQNDTTEQIMQVLLQDETGSYQADDFEQVLARIYFALALIHQGDESNAYALLRSAEEFQQEKRALYSQIPFTKDYQLADNALGKYLFAILLEKRGDFANAKILYRQASQLLSNEQTLEGIPSKKKKSATLLVLCHNGNAPFKISSICAASAASATALEILLTSRHQGPAFSTMMGIPVPALRQWPHSTPVPTIAEVDGNTQPLVTVYSVNQAAEEQLCQKIPVIVAKGVARMAIRRCAVAYADRQDPTLGMLTDLAMCAVNYNTRADTRSWTTLPAFIDLTRFEVDAGNHELSIQLLDPLFGLRNQSFRLNLESTDLCIIHVFNIHPGITRILIPSKNLVTYGD